MCPGQLAVYYCKSVDQTEIIWVINGSSLSFGGSSQPGDFRSVGSSVAYLVARNVDVLSEFPFPGNRTSVLETRFELNSPTNIIISCNGLSKSILIVGKL